MGNLCSGSGGGAFEQSYVLLDELGTGFTATVYEACPRPAGNSLSSRQSSGSNRQQLAVKVVDKKRFNREELAGLLKEAEFLSELNHENVVKLHGFFNDRPSKAYLVLDLLSGGDLFGRLEERTTYDEGSARDLTRNLLKALAHLEEHSIVHRDLKLAALMLRSADSDSDGVLIDFGLAERCQGRNLTQQCGTPAYVAPEMLREPCEGYGCDVDVWAAGVILFTLLGGYAPFRASKAGERGERELYRLIEKQPLEFDPQWWGGVGSDAQAMVSQLLNKDPDARPSAAQCLGHRWFVNNPPGTGTRVSHLDRGIRHSQSFPPSTGPSGRRSQPAPPKAKPALSSGNGRGGRGGRAGGGRGGFQRPGSLKKTASGASSRAGGGSPNSGRSPGGASGRSTPRSTPRSTSRSRGSTVRGGARAMTPIVNPAGAKGF